MSKKLVNKILSKDEKHSDESSINLNEIIDKIHDGYEHKKGPYFAKRTGFTPSGLTYGAGKCPRMWYLWFEGNEAENTNTWYEVANMDSGSDRHTRIETAMENAGILVTKEAQLKYENPTISGKTDAVIKWNDQNILTEIKTKTDEGFQRTKKPANYHIEQLLIYMKIMKQAFGILIYENKNNHEMLMFPIRLNQKYKDFVNYFFDWMKSGEAAFKEGKLPENPYRVKYNSRDCKGCMFLKVCQTKPVGDIKIESRKDLE
jgi:CRISPR/Cas system-associated exonuclease Cas4 (RecB family)